MAGAMNLTYILYTAFRLAPFILVSFFTLSSVLNQDLKGIIYLAGLLFACFISVMLNSFSIFAYEIPEDVQPVCNALTLSDTGRVSNIPLSMVAIAYTFGYLLFVIIKHNLANRNISTLVIFPTMIIAEGIWNTLYKCCSPFALIAALIIGMGWGAAWAAIINTTGSVKLQYFNGISNPQVCSRPSKQKFKCTMAK
jgi:hypothetical protein